MDLSMLSTHTPEVTNEDFVHSMTDRPRYLDFFKKKARGIAKNIGVKSDSCMSFQ